MNNRRHLFWPFYLVLKFADEVGAVCTRRLFAQLCCLWWVLCKVVDVNIYHALPGVQYKYVYALISHNSAVTFPLFSPSHFLSNESNNIKPFLRSALQYSVRYHFRLPLNGISDIFANHPSTALSCRPSFFSCSVSSSIPDILFCRNNL